MSILWIILAIVVIIAILKVLSEFAAGFVRAIIFVIFGLSVVYVLVVYYDEIAAFIQGLAG